MDVSKTKVLTTESDSVHFSGAKLPAKDFFFLGCERESDTAP